MEFLFSEDQQLFQEGVRDFLSKECTPEQIRSLWDTDDGRSQGLWKALGELGLLGVLASEDHGGLGGNEVDFVLLLEEAGRAALSEPLAQNSALAIPLIRDLGSAELANTWLPRLTAGEATAVVGLEADPLVHAADSADLLILQHGSELHAVPGDSVTCVRQECNDFSRRLFQVDWTPDTATCIASGSQAEALIDLTFDRAILAAAAQQLGICQQLIDLAVDYAREREQFGVPIGSFQAVKHMLANVAVKLEFARPVVYRAADSVARGGDHRSLEVSHAKVAACEAAVAGAKASLQVHGAIGYTWEVDLHLWMKRAWALDVAWGTPSFHLARVGATVLADGTRIGPGGLDA
ncbi:acyl-CoA/acyl-ACP dehydrogenase [Myxococcota bacterium]|nr:acyl-CoA/acyl-ACP dehydrogenase [Myxococcota bacterium]